MPRRTDCRSRRVLSLLLAGLLAPALAACSGEPYPIETSVNPPWSPGAHQALPQVDPPLSARAHRIAVCYGTHVNKEDEVLARAEDFCEGGRLLLEDQDVFWNGCSILQPVRATYICDPPEDGAAAETN